MPCTYSECVAGSMTAVPPWLRSKCRPDGVMMPQPSSSGVIVHDDCGVARLEAPAHFGFELRARAVALVGQRIALRPCSRRPARRAPSRRAASARARIGESIRRRAQRGHRAQHEAAPIGTCRRAAAKIGRSRIAALDGELVRFMRAAFVDARSPVRRGPFGDRGLRHPPAPACIALPTCAACRPATLSAVRCRILRRSRRGRQGVDVHAGIERREHRERDGRKLGLQRRREADRHRNRRRRGAR